MHLRSKESMQEVVLKMVFKISENEMSQADVLRTVTNLLSDLEKVFEYKCTDQHKEDLDAYNHKRLLNDNYFIAKSLKKAKFQEINEMLNHLGMQRLLNMYAYISRQIYMRIKILQEMNVLNAEINQQFDAPNPISNKKPPSVMIEERLQHLILHRNDLLKTLKQREYLIAIMRYYYINQAIQLLQVNKQLQMTFFKGMSMQSIRIFIKGYFKLKEEEILRALLISEDIQMLLANSAKLQKQNESALVNCYQLASFKPRIDKLNAKADNEKVSTLQMIKILGTQTGHLTVNTLASNEQCEKLLDDFEQHRVIKKPLVEHLKVTKEQTQLILMDKRSIADIDTQLEQIKETLEVKDELDEDVVRKLFEKVENDTTDILLKENALRAQFDIDELSLTLDEFTIDESHMMFVTKI